MGTRMSNYVPPPLRTKDITSVKGQVFIDACARPFFSGRDFHMIGWCVQDRSGAEVDEVGMGLEHVLLSSRAGINQDIGDKEVFR